MMVVTADYIADYTAPLLTTQVHITGRRSETDFLTTIEDVSMNVPRVETPIGQFWEIKRLVLDLVAGEGLEPPTPGL
jgi:hypothetical protein